MSAAGSYPQRNFSESQQIFVFDPILSNFARVPGQIFLQAAVTQIEKSGRSLISFDTLDEAKAEDIPSGQYILTGGDTVTLDGGQAIYRVSDPGSGGIAMDNGNELVILFRANVGDAGNYDVGLDDNEIPLNSTVLAYIADAEKQSKSITIDVAADSDITLTDEQNLYGQITITDTGSTLTGDINLIVSNANRLFSVINDTDYQIKVKTSGGAGVHVPADGTYSLMCDGTNVLTNGNKNRIQQLPFSEYTSTTHTYLNSITQSQIESIIMVGGLPTSNTTYPESVLCCNSIEEFPTNWRLLSSQSTDVSDIRMSVDYSSDTSFTVGATVTAIVRTVFIELKHGVTY